TSINQYYRLRSMYLMTNVESRGMLMTTLPPIALVDLSQYIDCRGDEPVLRDSGIPVSTIAIRALSGSWSLAHLAYEFTVPDVEVLAALLYYEQYRDLPVLANLNTELEFEALD
ncbi:MAG: DUF433 domain-containing protein, partial [Chloroflexota bacterium]